MNFLSTDLNKPSPIITKKLDSQKFMLAAEAAAIERNVFLAGPYIEIEKNPRRGKKHTAARLRHHLYWKMTGAGALVTMGEYQKLVDDHEVLLGDINNSALAELKHARDEVDAVIMIPSSPGSFLELGAFALDEEICRKMLIIVDGQYADSDKNYLNTGPLVGAKNDYSELEYIDYEDFEACWAKVEPFVQRQIARKAARGIKPR